MKMIIKYCDICSSSVLNEGYIKNEYDNRANKIEYREFYRGKKINYTGILGKYDVITECPHKEQYELNKRKQNELRQKILNFIQSIEVETENERYFFDQICLAVCNVETV